MGCCIKSKARTHSNRIQNSCQKVRSIPYAALPRISQEIDPLMAANVLSSVDHSDCAIPIVIVQKKDESIWLSADYSTGVEDAIEQYQAHLQRLMTSSKSGGGRHFSRLGYLNRISSTVCISVHLPHLLYSVPILLINLIICCYRTITTC